MTLLFNEQSYLRDCTRTGSDFRLPALEDRRGCEGDGWVGRACVRRVLQRGGRGCLGSAPLFRLYPGSEIHLEEYTKIHQVRLKLHLGRRYTTLHFEARVDTPTLHFGGSLSISEFARYTTLHFGARIDTPTLHFGGSLSISEFCKSGTTSPRTKCYAGGRTPYVSANRGPIHLISGIEKTQRSHPVPDFLRFLRGLGLGGTGFSS